MSYTVKYRNGVIPPRGRLEEMLRSMQAPTAKTDREFFRGQPRLDEQLGDMLPAHLKIAERHGFRPGVNDVYCPEIARFPGDPEAYVSPSGGRSQILRVLEKNDWDCLEGSTVVRRSEGRNPPKAAAPLGEDLIKGEIAYQIALNPSIASRPMQELREMAIDRCTPKYGVPEGMTVPVEDGMSFLKPGDLDMAIRADDYQPDPESL